jgi:S1-C subfamily serine protease
LFPYPHPKSIGLILDPDQRAMVKEVVAGSPAAGAGFKAGDSITRMNNQPLLSIADVQWVLQRTDPDGGNIEATILRKGSKHGLTLQLERGWRKTDDISWRSSAWGLRRMATGGMLLREATPEERKKAGIADGAMALRADHVGEFDAHAAAKRAGFRKGDLIVEFDGQTDLVRETDLFHYAMTKRKAGEKVPVVVWREGKKEKLQLPLQN